VRPIADNALAISPQNVDIVRAWMRDWRSQWGDYDEVVEQIIDLGQAAGLAYREAGDSTDRVAVLVHGYPESSYMWRHALPALGAIGWRALAPDLPGYGDSEPDPPGTWERYVEALEHFVRELDLAPVALVTHDWGVSIGLLWACDHADSVRALVISDGGFFRDREWHDLAKAMRTPGKGERLIRSYTREGFGEAMRGLSNRITDEALDDYWKAFADETRRLGHLELYRSGDFEKLAPYEGCVAKLSVPTLIVWGRQDRFAGVELAHRFHSEIPGSELRILDNAGHFVWEDEPEQATLTLVDFLERRVG
jgi:haloalkane dehalogenase